MPVAGINHVNIITERLDETADFYVRLLDLTRALPMGGVMTFRGAWLHDSQGAAILHIVAFDPAKHHKVDAGPATPTGAIDHVAFACTGFEAMLARCAELGLEHRVNDRKYGDLRQIFVNDPNGVKLELNFHGD